MRRARAAFVVALVLCQCLQKWLVAAQQAMPSAAPTANSTPSDTAPTGGPTTSPPTTSPPTTSEPTTNPLTTSPLTTNPPTTNPPTSSPPTTSPTTHGELTLYDMLEYMNMTYIQALVSADPSGDFEALLKNELNRESRINLGMDPDPPNDMNLTVFTFPNDQMSEVVAEVLMTLEDRTYTLDALRMMMRYHVIEGCYTFGQLKNMVGQQLTTLNGTINVVRAKQEFAHGGIALEDGQGRQTIFSSTVDVFASNGVMHVLLDVMRAPELVRLLAVPPPIQTTETPNSGALSGVAPCTGCRAATAVVAAVCATLALVLSS